MSEQTVLAVGHALHRVGGHCWKLGVFLEGELPGVDHQVVVVLERFVKKVREQELA